MPIGRGRRNKNVKMLSSEAAKLILNKLAIKAPYLKKLNISKLNDRPIKSQVIFLRLLAEAIWKLVNPLIKIESRRRTSSGGESQL